MNIDMAERKSNARLKEQIDENLKRVYEEALNEEIPDRFKQLLAQLKAKEGGK
ncbi:NepR family anti-sigma factor [Pontitalea aquivivens]|uniref:NepR family anti-sigma factor n=1 Tax=Pontitalea aquivivens TaxID=3388663 RepID=UPI003970B043